MSLADSPVPLGTMTSDSSPAEPAAVRAFWDYSVTEMIDLYRPIMMAASIVLPFIIVCICLYFWDPSSIAVGMAGLAVAAVATLPSVLWLRGVVRGLPIVPIIGLFDIPLFALPPITGQGEVGFFSESEVIASCLKEALFLLIITGVWVATSRPWPMPAMLRRLPSDPASALRFHRACIFLLFLSALYAVAVPADWLWPYVLIHLPFGAGSIIRTFTQASGFIAIFMLAVAHGQGRLTTPQKVLAGTFLAFLLMGLSATLILASVVLPLVALVSGRALGKGRFPIVLVAVLIILLNILHIGKGPLRREYWPQFGGSGQAITPLDYPAFYGRWFTIGRAEKEAVGPLELESDTPAILNRASLMQMLLLAQQMAPAEVPHLNGATYSPVPALLIPRVLWPDKPRTHEGQIILNVHFGRQTLEDTLRTYISWGILAEAWANFGWAGIITMAVLIGWLMGQVTGLSATVPMGSLRFLIGVLIMLLAFSLTQSVVSIWVSALFQSAVAVMAASMLFMRKAPLV